MRVTGEKNNANSFSPLTIGSERRAREGCGGRARKRARRAAAVAMLEVEKGLVAAAVAFVDLD